MRVENEEIINIIERVSRIKFFPRWTSTELEEEEEEERKRGREGEGKGNMPDADVRKM